MGSVRVLGPWALGPGPLGPWALAPGPWALGPLPLGPWALAPGPWALGPLSLGPWALVPGPLGPWALRLASERFRSSNPLSPTSLSAMASFLPVFGKNRLPPKSQSLIAGSWTPRPQVDDPFLLQCYSPECDALFSQWKEGARRGLTWEEMQQTWPECNVCQEERQRRCRLVRCNDARIPREPFLSAPYVHQFNQPKYHAMLLRAAEHANAQRLYTLWYAAQDTPENPAHVA